MLLESRQLPEFCQHTVASGWLDEAVGDNAKEAVSSEPRLTGWYGPRDAIFVQFECSDVCQQPKLDAQVVWDEGVGV